MPDELRPTDVIKTPGVPYYTESGEKRIDGMNMAEMTLFKIYQAKIQVKQMFCDHPRESQTRVFVEQSNERITCNLCNKVWYD